jgi:hypothetical protein
MGRLRKRAASQGRPADDEIRNQEVLRANRELAAYFRGRRTEREARAALKIIKAFVRDRERTDPATRRPLPIAAATKEPAPARPGRILRTISSRASSQTAVADAPRPAPAHDDED